MSAWFKSREPAVLKFQRWILSVPNKKILSIKQNQPDLQVKKDWSGNWSYEGVKVPFESHEHICQVFNEIDQKLFFGITYRYLCKVLVQLGAFEAKSEEQKKFYNKSEYNRKINRKCCGINLKEFVKIVAEMKPKEEEMEGWIQKVVGKMKDLQNDQIHWEDKYIPLRIELIKMFSSSKSEKKEFISNLLIDNPFMRITELGKQTLEVK